MKKLSIRKFKFIGIIVASVFLFLMIVPTAFAVSESRYHRSDTHTVNGLNAYKLGTTNSASKSYIESHKELVLYYGCPYMSLPVYYNSDIYIRHSNGAQTLLGSSIAQTARQSIIAEEGYQSNTWSCPKTSLSPTDAIRVTENVVVESYSETTTRRNFITEQLDSVMLEATTWTFNRYTWYNTFCVPSGAGSLSGTLGRTYHGSSSYNTRIEGFSYTPYTPPAPTYVDCGFRVRTGDLTLTIACEPAGTLTSPLRILKGGSTYGIVLVATTDANASPLRIQTSSGVKALRKY